MTLVLGLSYGYHDSAVALVEDGNLIAAVHEERFSRVKFDSRFPTNALQWLVEEYNLAHQEIHVAYYEDPDLKRNRQLWNIKQSLPHLNLLSKIPQTLLLSKNSIKEEILGVLDSSGVSGLLSFRFIEHHESHVSSSFYASGFKDAAGLVADAVGEWDTTSLWRCSKDELTKIQSQKFPNSLGLLYSMVTFFCGFKVNSGEYKLMGLAPYGKPNYLDEMQELCELSSIGFPLLNRYYLGFLKNESIVTDKMEDLFGFPIRGTDPLLQKHADLAASVQVTLEQSLVRLTKSLFELQDSRNLVFSGGVALNCVATNKLLLLNKEIENMYVFPAAGDAGGAVGAALRTAALIEKEVGQVVSFPLKLKDVYLGRSFPDSEIKAYLTSLGLEFKPLEIKEIANLLVSGSIVGWFQGRSEFGPRALGNRSILADPRIPKGQIHINEKIKFRESFRPFAPVVTDRSFDTIFLDKEMTDYMLRTTSVRDYSYSTTTLDDPDAPISIENKLEGLKSKVPSVTHLDGSARVQTLSLDQNPRLFELLEQFGKLSGVECLINTSFNVRGEPIVDSPEDAVRCFATTGIDILVLGKYVIEKNKYNSDILSVFTSALGED
jgi:carbamoyltransferase